MTPLGDAAVLLSFGNIIDRETNRQVEAIADYFKQYPFVGLTDTVRAYCSITFCFDPVQIRRAIQAGTMVFDWVKKNIEGALPGLQRGERYDSGVQAIVEIPVCYDASLTNDLGVISLATGLSVGEIIQCHSAATYHVYMLGFLPGFAYMGTVESRIELPRKSKPAKTKAGAVAIAGKQTGIYPLDSFGGWNILGHTPQKMFEPWKKEPCFLKAGQEVKFYSINLAEYYQLV